MSYDDECLQAQCNEAQFTRERDEPLDRLLGELKHAYSSEALTTAIIKLARQTIPRCDSEGRMWIERAEAALKPGAPGAMAGRTTHWEGCWRAHHECAVARVESLEREACKTRIFPPPSELRAAAHSLAHDYEGDDVMLSVAAWLRAVAAAMRSKGNV